MISNGEVVKKLKNKFHVKDKYEIAFIMGSGLNGSVPEIKDKIVVSYEEVGMPESKVKGFKGEFVFGKINQINVIQLTRYHFYESGDVAKVRLPFEILSLFGIKIVIMATSCGAVSDELEVGDLMVIKDHINFAGTNPLIGMENIKFVDMTNAYNKDLRKFAFESGKLCNIKLKEGITMQFSGPTYETPSEVIFARSLGVSTVSMSTAFDTICARNFGIKVLAFASVVNKAADFETKELITHDDVLKNSTENSMKLKLIIDKFLKLYYANLANKFI